MTQAFLTHNILIFYIVCNMLMTFPLFKSNIPFMHGQSKNVTVFHNVCLLPWASVVVPLFSLFCCLRSVLFLWQQNSPKRISFSYCELPKFLLWSYLLLLFKICFSWNGRIMEKNKMYLQQNLLQSLKFLHLF